MYGGSVGRAGAAARSSQASGAFLPARWGPALHLRALGETTAGAQSQGVLGMAVGRWVSGLNAAGGFSWDLEGAGLTPWRPGQLALAGAEPSMDFRVVIVRT